ncbi:MAG: biopolymer transporter ExbD [Phycisphaerae bacterium]|jgi:biopolymer transport protein ExbD|nr:biopolymer transporter ExbD [Phycisphaerae bacterium]
MTQEKKIAERWTCRRKSRRVFSWSLNLTPMMDVMFNLLIFFIVTASFTLPEGVLEARLPRTIGVSSEARAVPVVPIRIYLEPASGGQVSVIRVSTSLKGDASSLNLAKDFEDLYRLLMSLKDRPGIDENTPVIIAAKPEVVWDQVVNAYNAAIRAKYKSVVFAGY